ncbi:sigma factor [Streptomyces sp. NRRL WC-3744]|uniref:sigma factor n=1 Tax=Streptomyces sp. NRRL WC-3744 TaxID=1463935 RepID=UPI000B13FE9B|nr:sigma factor [Streptomyces sp. NRRL WC-3744]
MGTVVDDAAAVEFHAFFERHYAELACLAHVLTGEADVADDLAADALLALWHRWDRVRAADHPVAYARGVVANLAHTRIRGAVRERRRIALFWPRGEERTENPDVAGVVDVQEALRRLPFRKRACVVLRHAFDLSEKAWRLKEGRTVPAGEWVFAGQYGHERGGRDAGDDSYVMTGVAGGRAYTVTGGFAPHDGAWPGGSKTTETFGRPGPAPID